MPLENKSVAYKLCYDIEACLGRSNRSYLDHNGLERVTTAPSGRSKMVIVLYNDNKTFGPFIYGHCLVQ